MTAGLDFLSKITQCCAKKRGDVPESSMHNRYGLLMARRLLWLCVLPCALPLCSRDDERLLAEHAYSVRRFDKDERSLGWVYPNHPLRPLSRDAVYSFRRAN